MPSRSPTKPPKKRCTTCISAKASMRPKKAARRSPRFVLARRRRRASRADRALQHRNVVEIRPSPRVTLSLSKGDDAVSQYFLKLVS